MIPMVDAGVLQDLTYTFCIEGGLFIRWVYSVHGDVFICSYKKLIHCGD